MKGTRGTWIIIIVLLITVETAYTQTVEVTSPRTGETCTLGGTKEITWRYTGWRSSEQRWTISLIRGSTVVGTVVENVSGERYSWNVGQYRGGTAASGGDYKIKVTNVNRSWIQDTSDNFSIASSSTAQPGLQFRPIPSIVLYPDYAIDSLAFLNFQGSSVVWVNNELLFPYNGVQTSGTALIRVRWNRGSPPEGCQIGVRLTQRYLSGHVSPVMNIGESMVTNFNAQGIAEVRIPFIIRAGERDGALVNISANLIFGQNIRNERSCDSNPAHNSLAYNLTLKEFHQSTNDLIVQMSRQDLKLYRVWDGMEILGEIVNVGRSKVHWDTFRFEHKARFKNISRDPVGPVRNVKCRWDLYAKYNGRWGTYPYDSRDFTIESVTTTDWVVKSFGIEFSLDENYWEDLKIVVTVDPDNAIPDVNRSNNVQETIFNVTGD